MLTWAVTDRATRVVFYGCLALAAAALTPILAGDVSLPLMVLVLVLVSQAWRLAIARQVSVRLDETGIVKTIGNRTSRVPWEQVTALTFVRFLGSSQLVARTTSPVAWSVSDKLFWKAARTEVAVQVPPALVPQVRELLARLNLPLD